MEAVQDCPKTVKLDTLGEQTNGQHEGETVKRHASDCVA